jgi:DNA primase
VLYFICPYITEEDIVMGFIDFAAVKSAISIMEVCGWYSLELKQEQSSYRGCCPICKSDEKRAFTVNPDKDMYHCHKCKKGGDQISLVAAIEHISVKDAAARMLEHEEKPTPKAELKPLTHLIFEHEAVQALMSPEKAEEVGIGFANKGVLAGRLLLPIRDTSGKLLFYIGYSERLEPRWKLPKNA